MLNGSVPFQAAEAGVEARQAPAPVDRTRRDSAVDDLIDRLLVEAHTLGMPLEELGWRLNRRIDRFRRRREQVSRDDEAPGAPEERA